MIQKNKDVKTPNITYIPIPVNLIATESNSKPAIEIRKVLTDENYIKLILSAAFAEIPIQVQPVFRNKLHSIGTLIDKGILFFNKETEKYEFTF